MKKTRTIRSSWQKLLKNSWAIAGLVVLAVLVVGMFVRSLMVTPQVAEISGNSMQSCTSNVTSISFQQQCAFGSFQAASFKCRNSDLGMGSVYKTCKSYSEIMAEAQGVCGQTCIYSSPANTPTPTPTPPTGKSEISCNVKVYKLKNTDDINADPRLYATADRLFDPTQSKVVPGESFALLVDATAHNLSVTTSTVSAVTSNVSGSSEPIQIRATTQYCSSTDSWGKYMSCTHPGVSYVSGVTQRLSIGMTVQIQKNIYEQAKASMRFGLYNIIDGGSGYSSECYATLLPSDSTSTARPTPIPTSSPTPTPTPIPPVGCYYQESYCLNKLIGGDCKLLLQCPTPTPTPVPVITSEAQTPLVVPTVSPTPTPLPIAPEGCYYQRRLCINTIIGGTCAPSLYCPKQAKQTFNVCMKDCRANSSYARCFRTCWSR